MTDAPAGPGDHGQLPDARPDLPDHHDLDRTPDYRVLLLIAAIVLVAALAVGIGWS